MSEFYDSLDPQAVAEVPTDEIAWWAARIDRINFALDENTSVSVGGMADDGQIVWEVANRARKGTDYEEDELFEEAILYELKRGIDLERILEAIEYDDSRDPSNAESTHNAVRVVGQLALETGLLRVGMLEVSESRRHSLAVPIGTVAALCFERADIEESIDRQLFVRKDEIRQGIDAIVSVAPPRYVEYEGRPIGYDEPEQFRESVYRFLSFSQNDGFLKKLSLQPDAELSPWWQELQRDLGRIDEAAA